LNVVEKEVEKLLEEQRFLATSPPVNSENGQSLLPLFLLSLLISLDFHLLTDLGLPEVNVNGGW
jgi:hypothetical protein